MENNLVKKIYILYSKEIYLYIYSICHSKEIAEDLTQETFVKAILSLANSHKNMRAWLYIVARNLTYNYLRKHNKEIIKDEIIVEEFNEPVDEIIKNEDKRYLYKTLFKIKSETREILILKYFNGLSIKEISSITNLTEQNIKVIIHRGKRKVRKIMEEEGYEI